MSFESKEDESESAAHLRQLAADMPEVRVVHATPAARAIRSQVLRVLLNPLQAVPGYTSSPRLEDGYWKRRGEKTRRENGRQTRPSARS